MSLIGSLIDISFIKRFLEHLLDEFFVIILGRSDKISIRDLKMVSYLFPFLRHGIQIRHDFFALFSSFFEDILAIFIISRRKFDGIAE